MQPRTAAVPLRARIASALETERRNDRKGLGWVRHGGPRYSGSLATVVTSRGQLVNARILQWRLALKGGPPLGSVFPPTAKSSRPESPAPTPKNEKVSRAATRLPRQRSGREGRGVSFDHLVGAGEQRFVPGQSHAAANNSRHSLLSGSICRSSRHRSGSKGRARSGRSDKWRRASDCCTRRRRRPARPSPPLPRSRSPETSADRTGMSKLIAITPEMAKAIED
jgi:hypothetical protein